MAGSRLWAGALLAAPLLCCAFEGVQVLHRFGLADGQNPVGRLVMGPDGRLYGTTVLAGAANKGTIYALALDGTLTVLHSFTGPDGQSTSAGLVVGGDGQLYGSTPSGTVVLGGRSVAFGGTLFRQSPAGAFGTLQRFTGGGRATGLQPGELVDGGDGFFYGTMAEGGRAGRGTVFRMRLDGEVATLHAFTPNEGSGPGPGLTAASDGQLYGTLTNHAGVGWGSLMRVSRSGQVSYLHTFNGEDGHDPQPWLAEGDGGHLYGVTRGGGVADAGTVFRLDPNASFSVLHHFNGDDGRQPVGLVSGPDGALYGATVGGGWLDAGTLFRITPDGSLRTLQLLNATTGGHPASRPRFMPDGLLYGTTGVYSAGSVTSLGVVWRFDALAPQPPELRAGKVCYPRGPFVGSNGCGTPFDVLVGDSYRISWATANLDGCVASGAWAGARAPAGHQDFHASLAGVYTYTLDCSGPGGTRSSSQTVVVGPPM